MKNLTINKITGNSITDCPFKIGFLIFFFSAFIFSANTSKIEAQWQYVGDPVIYCITLSFSFTSDGSTPYIAYNTENNFSVIVSRFDGVSWVNVGSIPNDMPLDNEYLTFDGVTPYISYNRIFYNIDSIGYHWETKVMKFDGLNWIYVGPSCDSTTPGYNNYHDLLVIDHVPYIAFSAEANSLKTVVKKFNGNNWEYIGSSDISPINTSFQKLAYDGSNLFVAYSDMSSGVSVKKFDGGNWDYVGTPGFTTGLAKYLSLVIINGTPYIAYQDEANGFKTTVMKFNSFDWVNVGLPGFSSGVAKYQTLSFSDSLPILSYLDIANGGMSVMKFDGINWVNVGHAGFTQGIYDVYNAPNLTIINGTPYVAFIENSNLCPWYPVSVMKFQDNPLPIELTSFNSNVRFRNVELTWTTTSETNNSGFEIERKSVNGTWTNAGFIAGHGTVTYPVNYSFTDGDLASSTYNYRLKQIDFNGNYEFFDLSEEVVIGVPDKFSLHQNYPNPFNPVTKIRYDLPVNGNISLKIYDNTGREIKTLVSEFKEAGYYTVEFNGSGFASGVYYYKIESGNFIATKKMVLIK